MNEITKLNDLFYSSLQSIVGAIEVNESWIMSKEQANFCMEAKSVIQKIWNSLNESDRHTVDEKFREIHGPREAPESGSASGEAIWAHDALQALNVLLNR